MATLKDIAARTGLTISTVSDILKDRPGSRYSETTRTKVRKAAEELGYDRNRLVEGMIKGKSNLIGVVVPDLQNPFYNALLHAAAPVLREAGYNLLIEEAAPDVSPELEAKALQELSEFRVDGVVACLIHGSAHASAFRKLARRGAAITGLGLPDDAAGAGVASFGIVMERGIREACAHLVERGRKRFAFLGNFPWDAKLGRRWEFLTAALDDLGVRGQPETSIPCAHSMRGAFEAFGDFLAKTPAGERPDTLFALNENLAIGACRAAADAGLRVPKDLAVVGFDNTDLGAMQVPALSTIGVDLDTLGTAIAGSLLAQLRAGDAPAAEHFEARFIPRETT